MGRLWVREAKLVKNYIPILKCVLNTFPLCLSGTAINLIFCKSWSFSWYNWIRLTKKRLDIWIYEQKSTYSTFQDDFVCFHGQRFFFWIVDHSKSKKYIKFDFLGSMYRGSPTYTKITNTVSTNTFFGLCMCKWGN